MTQTRTSNWVWVCIPIPFPFVDVNTVDSPLSANGFWVLLQFAVRGRAMFHMGISEKMVVINSGHKIITEITSFMKLVHCMLVWLYVHNYVYKICCILCSWVMADLNRQNNHCLMCFTCCCSLLFWHLSSFSCFLSMKSETVMCKLHIWRDFLLLFVVKDMVFVWE